MHFIAFSLLLAAPCTLAAVLSPRATEAPTCIGLSVKSNNGNRKVALVIDSSGSMAESDPYNLRLAAGRALNDWLITKAEAGSGKQADLVTVINFDDAAYLDYPLGDPAGANSSFDAIGADGGTFIAGGVDMGIAQLTSSGSGSTSGRSSIIVFTDGEDYDTATLVDSINKAHSLGIRVSFGFLDASSSIQDKDVLAAIQNSGGVYATITTEDASNNFINFAILNGLTYNDNPSGNNSTLLAGLTIADFITGSETQTLTYNAQANERINFTVESVDAGTITAQAIFGGKVLNGTTTTYYGDSVMPIVAPNAGAIEIKVTAKNALPNSMFVVGASSNMPIQNCTLAVNPSGGGGGGLSTGGKVGLGLGIPALIAGIGVGAFFLFKYFGGMIPPFKNPFKKPPLPDTEAHQPPEMHQPPEYHGPEKPGLVSNVIPIHGPEGLQGLPAVPPPPPVTKPAPLSNDPSSLPPDSESLQNIGQNVAHDPHKHHKHRRHKKRKNDEEPHHHHLPPNHPCAQLAVTDAKCPLFIVGHVCKDPEAEPKGPCACTDKKCPLNDKDHECDIDDKDGIGELETGCECVDEECPTQKELDKKKRERVVSGLVVSGAKIGVGEVVKGAFGN